MKKIAIMQPTYLPWSGYFGMIDCVDLFVFLDSVQFEKRSWQQRNKIKTAIGEHWLTVPVISKGKREQKINQVEVDKNSNFYLKHKKSIEMNYSKTNYFKNYINELLPLLNSPSPKLVDLNISIILFLSKLLNISTKYVKSSELNSKGDKANLLASISKEVDAKIYVSPQGSKQYMCDSDAFKKAGIKVKYFSYSHPVYAQKFGKFLPYMSFVDMIFNCGEVESKKIIKNNSTIIL